MNGYFQWQIHRVVKNLTHKMATCQPFLHKVYSSTVSWLNWDLEGGKPKYPEKNPQSRDENQQQNLPTNSENSGNRNWATLVEGECSHSCDIPAPKNTKIPRYWTFAG